MEDVNHLYRLSQQELVGMEDTMMREISKKDAELAAAYFKLEEQAKQLAEQAQNSANQTHFEEVRYSSIASSRLLGCTADRAASGCRGCGFPGEDTALCRRGAVG